MSSQQDKRKALAKRLISQTVQLKALNISIGKLRVQETKRVQHTSWQEGHPDDSGTIDIITELGHVSRHVGNAIKQLEELARILNDMGPDGE